MALKLSDAKSLLAQVVAYNMEQFGNGTLDNRIVPFFIGPPGVGKTAITKQVAKALDIEYKLSIIAQMDAGEMAGLPVMNKDFSKMIRLRPDYLPDYVPNEKTGVDDSVGIFNLDELPQAFLANLNIASQLVNEWRVGEHKVPDGWTICCTGNRPEDKAGTTSLPMHLRDRLMFIELAVDPEEWLGYASERHVDPRIRGYIRQNPGKLMDFQVGANSFPTPRSWEKTSAILSLDLAKNVRAEAIRAQIGEGHGTTFEAWLKVENKMPRWQDIVADPDKAPVFDQKDADVLYMLLASLADVADAKNIGAILKYVGRLPKQEFAVYFVTDTLKQKPALGETKEIKDWKVRVGAALLM